MLMKWFGLKGLKEKIDVEVKGLMKSLYTPHFCDKTHQ